MNNGILIFAHNNRQIDYARMSLVSGSLAKKNLGVPVSLATDPSTVEWMQESKIFDKASEIFDQIIIVKRPEENNNRKFFDGKDNFVAPFNNGNRSTVWDVTPYDQTLLIDSDYFVLSDNLSKYWNVDADVLIGSGYNDIVGNERAGYLDRYISETGVKMLWATTVMFKKNERSKVFFDLVQHIKENYRHFSDIYRYNPNMFRNDIAFSIARHIMYGFEQDSDYSLPPIFSVTDKDILYSVDADKFTFLVTPKLNENYCLATVKNQDVHIMNKQSISRNLDKLMELI